MAVMDCYGEINTMLGDNKSGRVVISAEMTADDSHFSFEKQGSLSTDTMLLVVYALLFALNFIDLRKFDRKYDTMNTPHMYCIIAMGFNCGAIVANLFHHMSYAHNGKGILFLEILATIMEMISQCVMALLVLMLVNGWMSRFQRFSYEDGFDTYGPLWIIVLMVHVAFGAFTFVDADAYHKYHDFHGWQGNLLICAKLALVGIYFWYYQSVKD